MSAEWIKPGTDVAIVYRGSGMWRTEAHYDRSRIERLTKTQVILHNGRRFRISDLREVGVDTYDSGDLVPSTDPRLPEIDEKRRVQKIRGQARAAVDEWRVGAGGSAQLARKAAVALLLYADTIDPPETA